MYYLHLELTDGFIVSPEQLADILDIDLRPYYFSVHLRGIVVVSRNNLFERGVADSLKSALHIYELMLRKQQPYKYRITQKWRRPKLAETA